MFVCLFVLFTYPDPTITKSIIWKDHPNYSCDILSSAFEVEYELSLLQCHDRCQNTTICKGTLWFEYLKHDVTNDPSRCYLLNNFCDFQYFNSSPVVASFWYHNVTQQTQCTNYPSLWRDKYLDGCDKYSVGGICENTFNQTSKIFILEDASEFNAFEACCACAGSLFQYNTSLDTNNAFIIEAVWKPSHNNDITDNMLCQSYSQSLVPYVSSKWNINLFLGICDYFTNKAVNKYSRIYSISNNANEDLQSVDYQQLKAYDCTDSYSSKVIFYVCRQFDFANYAYIIDISINYTIYLNQAFIDINDFINNDKNNEIITQTQCNIGPLIHDNNKSNIIAALLCGFMTDSPTKYPSMSPNPKPTRSPTLKPTKYPTTTPTFYPSESPTLRPSYFPTLRPSDFPTENPYSEKTQVTAFCLTFFFGWFGAGRFYVGDGGGGAWQVIMFVFVCCCGVCGIAMLDGSEDIGTGALGVSGCCCYALLIWWICDLAIIGANNLSDSNDMELQPW